MGSCPGGRRRPRCRTVPMAWIPDSLALRRSKGKPNKLYLAYLGLQAIFQMNVAVSDQWPTAMAAAVLGRAADLPRSANIMVAATTQSAAG